MKKRAVFVLALATAALVGSAATAATGWRVFGSSSDTGSYGTSISLEGKAVAPKGLAIRVHAAKPTDVSWLLSCTGETKAAADGAVVPTGMLTAQSCSVSAIATSNATRLRVELLRR